MKTWEQVSAEMQLNGTPLSALGYCRIASDEARKGMIPAPPEASDAKYIEVSAEVRYWEDAEVDGHEDIDGTLIPFREGDLWKPVIRLEDGVVLNWPPMTTARIHYKVCDQGEYWLLDQDQNRIGKWCGDYVPDDFLCHLDKGYGDYIIFRVDENGKIVGWKKPTVTMSEWS